jgi:hypothetical protein
MTERQPNRLGMALRAVVPIWLAVWSVIWAAALSSSIFGWADQWQAVTGIPIGMAAGLAVVGLGELWRRR